MLYGYSELIMDGARMTLQLALCSLVLALLIGLVGRRRSCRPIDCCPAVFPVTPP
ncbi:Histidine transport system permease protein HisQ [Dickeya solani]|nr:Histidine transport system permease protein HisQ [Dickeya solani]